MQQRCVVCKREAANEPEATETFVVCAQCAEAFENTSDIESLRRLVDKIDDPVLLMQSNPRVVVTANRKAAELFGKEPTQMESRRGGEVFDCVHAFSVAGCGKDVHCEPCKIKGAVVDTFVSGRSFVKIANPLRVIKTGQGLAYDMQVSTTRAGRFALMRIDRYKKT